MKKMNMSKLHFLILSMPAVALMFPYSNSHAAMRVNNSSALKGQVQMDIARNAPAPVMAPQPARTITNENGTTTTISNEQMDACKMVYPNGQFDWVRPTVGMKTGASATCAALVELRSYQNSSGTTYTVLASDYLAAGDAIKCNVDSFNNLTMAGRDFTYPADEPPTIDDVAAVMAQEQKANAGFKILGAALVGGIGGNLLGKGDIGNDSPLGTSKDKLKSTAIGAAGAAALMTASTQSNNYKAGSIILSTGVNAAAGAVAGNLIASGDDVLKIADCKIKEDGQKEPTDATCLYGVIQITDTGGAKEAPNGKAWFYNVTKNTTYECVKKDDKNNNDEFKSCVSKSLSDVEFDSICQEECNGGFQEAECTNCLKNDKTKSHRYYITNDKDEILNQELNDKETKDKDFYIKIEKAKVVTQYIPARLKFEEGNKLFGYKYSDWVDTLKSKYESQPVYDSRGDKIENVTGNVTGKDFSPSMQSADDGAVVDFENRARTKSTMIGAGGGAALGALAGASGADSAINERYVTAVREYEDSLKNIVCYTGGRYLSVYNDVVMIPEMKNPEQ